MSLPRCLALACSLVLSGAVAGPARALDAVPLYDRVSIAGLIADAYPNTGISSARALNQDGDAVGYVIVDNQYRAFIYTAAFGVHLLPPLPGWSSHVAADVSNPDAQGQVLIVGDARNSIYSDPARAVMWIYDVLNGSVVETIDIGLLDGASQGLATAVNDQGLVVGYSWPAGYRPMVFDLADRTLREVDLPFAPVDINNANRVAGGTGRATLVKDPVTGEFDATDVEDLGSPPDTSLNGIAAINAEGHVTGTTTMPYTDGAGHFVKGATRYAGVWEILWAVSHFDSGSGINLTGDVVGTLGTSGAIRGALYIDALDAVYLLEDLQDPPAFLDAGLDINDAGWIAGGLAGAVLLERVGDLAPPSAPANLTAVPHEATWQQPWNAITLNWEDTSTLTQGFWVERRIAGSADDWIEIVTNWSNTQLWDMDVGLGVTYDYRVRAKGIAGFSEYSNVATATAPSDPVDTLPPVVTFLAPQDGQTVLGNVQVVVEATDNKGLGYIKISTVVNSSTQEICSESPTEGVASVTLDCIWNTGGLPPGWYPLNAYASDTLNGYDTDTIQVYVQEPGPCDDPPAEVLGLGFDEDAVTVYWTPMGVGYLYDLARQDIGAMLGGQPLECLASGLGSAGYADFDSPAAGQAFCYLVRATGDCGAGPWGATSDGQPRDAVCP